MKKSIIYFLVVILSLYSSCGNGLTKVVNPPKIDKAPPAENPPNTCYEYHTYKCPVDGAIFNVKSTKDLDGEAACNGSSGRSKYYHNYMYQSSTTKSCDPQKPFTCLWTCINGPGGNSACKLVQKLPQGQNPPFTVVCQYQEDLPPGEDIRYCAYANSGCK